MRNLEFLTEIRNQKGTYWYMKQRHENLIIHLRNLEAHLEWTKTIHQDIVKYSLILPIARNYIRYIEQEILHIKDVITWTEYILPIYWKLSKINIPLG